LCDDAAVHHLLILSRRAPEYHALVAAAGLPDLEITSTADAAAAASCASTFDMALGEPSLLRDLIARLTSIRWVQSTWAGVEPLLDPRLPRHYTLTNARGVFGGLMSEYVFAYALAHERRLLEKYRSQLESRWDPTAPGSLRGKTIGLLGVGTIGAAIARTAKAFAMRVKGYTRNSEQSRDVDEYFHEGRLTAFAADLDYLVSVMPATARTRGVIDADFLRALPARAVFINPGRGGVVDEPALADALRQQRIAGAVLDVFQQEPLPPDHAFWRTPNLLITSHTAALSFPEDIAPIFVENYRRLLAGEPLKYQVDFALEY
jgi:phosphoglycerate dehydrogenase-like enzyme